MLLSSFDPRLLLCAAWLPTSVSLVPPRWAPCCRWGQTFPVFEGQRCQGFMPPPWCLGSTAVTQRPKARAGWCVSQLCSTPSPGVQCQVQFLRCSGQDGFWWTAGLCSGKEVCLCHQRTCPHVGLPYPPSIWPPPFLVSSSRRCLTVQVLPFLADPLH